MSHKRNIGYPGGEKEHRRGSERWEEVPIEFLRPVGWQAHDGGGGACGCPRGLSANGASIYGEGISKGCPRKKPGDQEVAVCFWTRVPCQHSNVCHRTAMAGTQTSRALRRERVWTTRTACCGGCLTCSSCVYPPSLSSAIAGSHVLWRSSRSEKLHSVKRRLGFFI